jgi:hypothetical protein
MIYLSDRNTYSEMFQVKMEKKILPIVEQELFTGIFYWGMVFHVSQNDLLEL